MWRDFGALTSDNFRGQTGKNNGRKSGSSAAAVTGAAEPAAEPQPHLGPKQSSGQVASRGNEENSTTR